MAYGKVEHPRLNYVAEQVEQRLFISPKIVEHNVSAVLAKLEAGSLLGGDCHGDPA